MSKTLYAESVPAIRTTKQPLLLERCWRTLTRAAIPKVRRCAATLGFGLKRRWRKMQPMRQHGTGES